MTTANKLSICLCRLDSECFTCIVSFNPHGNSVMSKLAPCHRRSN